MIPVTSVRTASTSAHAPDPAGSASPLASAADQLEQLRFLHEVARLATTARTWDELLETVVDRTRDVLHADVSSLYLLDRDGAYLTLAATNGLDRFQIGRGACPVRGRRDRPGRRRSTATGDPRRQGRCPVPVGPRHRSAPFRGLDAVGAVDLARPDGRRAQCPDRAAARLHRRGHRAAGGGRRPAGGDHREGTPAIRSGRRGSRRSRRSTRPAAS